MVSVILPPGEEGRVAGLLRYNILGEPAEAEFNDLTLLATRLCNTPIALITLMDSDRQWFRSPGGMEIGEIPRDAAFCTHALLAPDFLEITDLSKDPRFRASPLVQNDPAIRFYAGTPLKAHEGWVLGTLSVMGREPRSLTPDQREGLEALGRQVMLQLELRLLSKAEKTLREEFSHKASFQEALLNTDASAIISSDANGLVTSFNSGAEQLLGYSAEEVVGKQTPMLWHDYGEVAARAAELSRELNRVIDPGYEVFVAKASRQKNETREWTYIRKDSSRAPVFLSVSARRGQQGQLTGFLAVAYDLTERKKAEIQRERMFNLSLDLMGVVGFDGYFQRVNPAFTQTLGFSSEEFLARPICEFVHPEDREETLAEMEKLRGGGQTLNFRNRYRCKEGGWKWLSWTAQPYPEEGLIYATARDVTKIQAVAVALAANEERLRGLNGSLEDLVSERTGELRESEERHRALTESANDAIVSTDSGNRILSWNKAAEKIFGYGTKEAMGQELTFVMPERDREEYRRGLLHHLETGDAWVIGKTIELRGLHRDGREFPLELSTSSWSTEAGKYFSGIFRDLTGQKEVENQRLRTQRLESLGTLSGGVAHDLNNALTPILLGLELLRFKNPESAEMLDTMATSARHGAAMVRQLLTFAKGVEGERLLIQPRHLFKELGAMIKGSFPKNIALRTEYDGETRTVLGDATQLHQVLLNLCVNARDAMPEGGKLVLEAGHETVDAEMAAMIPGARPGNYVVCRVKDSGTGISPEVMERMFEPFFTTKGPEQGTGLGLSTVLGIVKSHGGFVRVKSAENDGTTFSVYLPEAEAGLENAALLPYAMAAYRGRGEMILVVDDEPSVRQMAREVLTGLNFQVITAGDGTEALIQVAENRAALRAIITDVHMPHMDGINFVRVLRRMMPGAGIVVSSGRFEEKELREFKVLGVEQILSKPFTQEEMVERLGAVLSV